MINLTAFSKSPNRRRNTICRTVERPDHHFVMTLYDATIEYFWNIIHWGVLDLRNVDALLPCRVSQDIEVQNWTFEVTCGRGFCRRPEITPPGENSQRTSSWICCCIRLLISSFVSATICSSHRYVYKGPRPCTKCHLPYAPSKRMTTSRNAPGHCDTILWRSFGNSPIGGLAGLCSAGNVYFWHNLHHWRSTDLWRVENIVDSNYVT